MEKTPDEIEAINQRWHYLPDGHELPESKEEFAVRVLSELLPLMHNQVNGYGAKILIKEQIRRLQSGN